MSLGFVYGVEFIMVVSQDFEDTIYVDSHLNMIREIIVWGYQDDLSARWRTNTVESLDASSFSTSYFLGL